MHVRDRSEFLFRLALNTLLYCTTTTLCDELNRNWDYHINAKANNCYYIYAVLDLVVLAYCAVFGSLLDKKIIIQHCRRRKT